MTSPDTRAERDRCAERLSDDEYRRRERNKQRVRRAKRYAAGLKADGTPYTSTAPRRIRVDPTDLDPLPRLHLIETSAIPYLRRAAYQYGAECGAKGVVPTDILDPFRREFEDGWADGAKVRGIPLFDAARTCTVAVLT